MSWLARSIANSLKLDDDDDDNEANDNAKTFNTFNEADVKSSPKPESEANQSDSQSPSSTTSTPTARGVKEDLSELTKTFSRQFWGVASFLAPPPESSNSQSQISDPNPAEPSNQSSEVSDPKASDEAIISGIRGDIAEISERFKSGISKLSGNKTVSEITKIASNFLQFGSEEGKSLEEYELDGVVGVTEEVVFFARNIALHPETWLEFPLPDDADSDDFELSDAQQEHALAVERLAPRLAALRMELCPGYMSDNCFWKIYFVLLFPRLNKHDADVLLTAQIVEARSMLTRELQNRSNEKHESDLSGRGNVNSRETADASYDQHLSVLANAQPESVLRTSTNEAAPVAAAFEMEKHHIESNEIQIVDKPVVEETPVNPKQHSSSSSSHEFVGDKYDDDGDDWLKEETSEMVGVGGSNIPVGNDDDVSFSDLEDDDENVPMSYRKGTSGSDSSTKDSPDWVQLSGSSTNSVSDINTVESRHSGSEQVSARNPETKESNDWLNVDDIDVI
ncbi:BSD domain containing protein [Quillaja saponaria]|uniref:BSD domain containing protein n=1 Tax=Quillaja saponaria TaxID=32244 RepID=A0AAD7P738_QUISA|nr:BSD domain containing protein [Quillaja saponaria]